MDICRERDCVVLVGDAWGAPEVARRAVSRWVNQREARINIGQLTTAPRRVRIELEPGPGLGLAPFDMAVLGGGDVPLAVLPVSGREVVSLVLPQALPTVHCLTLRAVGGAEAIPVPGDDRALCFRVHDIAVDELPRDVVQVERGLTIGPGWYPMETFKDQSFRWARNEATIELNAQPRPAAVGLELEPGPGVGMKPFSLAILADGAQISRLVVEERQRVEIAWPSAEACSRLTLRVEGGGKPADGDPRTLNFRAFSQRE